MTITQIRSATSRDALAQDFAAIGEFFRDNPGAIAPEEFRCQVPVPRGLDQPARVEWIKALAASWRVPVVPDEDGTLHCSVREGRVVVCASVTPAGSGHIIRRIDDLNGRAPFAAVTRGAA